MKGWKVWVGTIGWALCQGLAATIPEYAGIFQNIANFAFAPLGVIGVAHKIEKAGGI